LASESATFSQSFVKVGLHPDWGGTYFLPRVVPTNIACEMFFLGDALDAQAALRYGIVNRVVAAEAFDATVADWAQRLAAKSPLLMRLGKDAMFRQQDMGFADALDYLQAQLSLAFATDDAREGVRAFFEKRAPVWRGS